MLQHQCKLGGYVVALLIALCALLGCTDGGSVHVQVAGSYQGTAQDSAAGTGTLTVTIAQNEATITGTWQLTFSNAANNNSGSITGSISHNSLNVTLQTSVPGACSYQLTATVTGSQITGNYTSVNCSRPSSGTVTITRQ